MTYIRHCFYIPNIFNFFIYTEEAQMGETFVIQIKNLLEVRCLLFFTQYYTLIWVKESCISFGQATSIVGNPTDNLSS